MTLGSQIQEREVQGPDKIHRRGEGGEGCVRMQIRDLRFCDSSVHVFSGYVASLSVIVTT